MTIATSLTKMPTASTDTNLDLWILDHAAIKNAVKSQPNAQTTAYNYAYESSSDVGAPLNLYHNVVRGKGTVENTIGLTGSFIATDSETGLKSILAPFSGRVILRTPSGLFVTPAHLGAISMCLMGLQIPTYASGVPSTAIWARMLDGQPAW